MGYYEKEIGVMLPCIKVRNKGVINKFYFHHWQETRDIKRIVKIMESIHGKNNVDFGMESERA